MLLNPSFKNTEAHVTNFNWMESYDRTKPEQDEIIRQLEAGEITTADAYNAIKKLGLWRTRPSTDPVLRQANPNLREIYDPLTGYKITDFQAMVPGREPNPDDAPYRERPPGGKPWPGYPKPIPPGGPPPKLAERYLEETYHNPQIASLTRSEHASLEKVFPGITNNINRFRKDHFNAGPMKIIPDTTGPVLPRLP